MPTVPHSRKHIDIEEVGRVPISKLRCKQLLATQGTPNVTILEFYPAGEVTRIITTANRQTRKDAAPETMVAKNSSAS
jgi:hypothetical protein